MQGPGSLTEYVDYVFASSRAPSFYHVLLSLDGAYHVLLLYRRSAITTPHGACTTPNEPRKAPRTERVAEALEAPASLLEAPPEAHVDQK